MSDLAVHWLSDLLAGQSGHSLPLDVKSSISLRLAKALIAGGDLDRAAAVLHEVAPSDNEERRELAAQRLSLARKEAEHFQRQRAWSEAAAAWLAVIELSPSDA